LPVLSPSFALTLRVAPDRGSGDPPKQPRRRRVGGPSPQSPFGPVGSPPPQRDGLLDRISPWFVLAAMSIALTFPHLDSFPSLDGRETWGLVAGVEEVALRRLPGALLVLITTFLVYGMLLPLVNRWQAFLAAMMLASSPVAIQAAVQANGDGVSLLAVTVIPLALIRGLDPDRTESWPTLPLSSLALSSLALWGALLATVPFGDPTALLSLFGAVLFLLRSEDRAGLARLFSPSFSLPGLAALIGVSLLFPGGVERSWARLAAIGADPIDGALALPILLLPALPLLVAQCSHAPTGMSGRIWRVALASGAMPLLALLLSPTRDWSLGIGLLPAACLTAALALEGDRAEGRGALRTLNFLVLRAGVLVWALVAGALALALLTLAEGRAIGIAIEAIGAFCAIGLGLMWGWQGRRDRLALATVLASGLICAGAMQAISVGGVFFGYVGS
jgi:hypothetical protein